MLLSTRCTKGVYVSAGPQMYQAENSHIKFLTISPWSKRKEFNKHMTN